MDFTSLHHRRGYARGGAFEDGDQLIAKVGEVIKLVIDPCEPVGPAGGDHIVALCRCAGELVEPEFDGGDESMRCRDGYGFEIRRSYDKITRFELLDDSLESLITVICWRGAGCFEINCVVAITRHPLHLLVHSTPFRDGGNLISPPPLRESVTAPEGGSGTAREGVVSLDGQNPTRDKMHIFSADESNRFPL